MQSRFLGFTRLALMIAPAFLACGAGAAGAADPLMERELGKVKVKNLVEISGMAASRANQGVLWVSNDGDSGRIYAIRTDGKFSGELRLPVRVNDVEEVALGPGPEHGVDYLYVGDIGDNKVRRFEVTVVRLKEPALGAIGESVQPAEVEQFRLAYPDGPHDAEAMFVDPISNELVLVTKEPDGAGLYTVSLQTLEDRKQTKLTFAGRLSVDNISSAAISPDGNRILLRREDRGWLWNRQPSESVAETLQGRPQVVTTRGRRQGKNGEAIAFRPDSACYYTLSEGKKQAIYEFDLPPTNSSDASGPAGKTDSVR